MAVSCSNGFLKKGVEGDSGADNFKRSRAREEQAVQFVRRKLGTATRLARHIGWTRPARPAEVPKMLSIYVYWGMRGSALVVPLVPTKGCMKVCCNVAIGHYGKTRRTALRRNSIRPLAGASGTTGELRVGLPSGSWPMWDAALKSNKQRATRRRSTQ